MYKTAKGKKIAHEVNEIDQEAIDHAKDIRPRVPGPSKKYLDDEIPLGAQFWGPMAYPLYDEKEGGKKPRSGGAKKADKLNLGELRNLLRGNTKRRGMGQDSDSSDSSDSSGSSDDSERDGGGRKKKKGHKKGGAHERWETIAEKMRGAGIGRAYGGSVKESLGYDMASRPPLRPQIPITQEGGAMRGGAKEDLLNAIRENPEEAKMALSQMVKYVPEGDKKNTAEFLRTISGIVHDITPLLQLIASLRKGSGMSGGRELQSFETMHGNFQGGKKKEKPSTKRAPSAWNIFVKKVSKEQGLNMQETLKYIKEHDLWNKKK